MFVDAAGEEVLVSRLDELVRHFDQMPDFDGDFAGAVERAIADPSFARAPHMLVVDLAAATVTPLLPTSLQGRPHGGDGTARGGYGRSVFDRDGYRFRYCGFDLGATYRRWLQLSVDHVVPAQMRHHQDHPFPAEYVEDMANLVTCCRSCNDFGNRYVVSPQFPGDGEPSFALRDRVFVQRRAPIAPAHLREQEHYLTLVPQPRAGRQPGESA